MSNFWCGFKKRAEAHVPLKRHVIVLYWNSQNQDVKDVVDRFRLRHPTIKVRSINGNKAGKKLSLHKINKLPTILLLRDGREKRRLTGPEVTSYTLLSQLFREASV